MNETHSPQEAVADRLRRMLRDFVTVWDCSEEAALDRLIREWRASAQEVASLTDELGGYKRWASSVNEALNTGDGSYRP